MARAACSLSSVESRLVASSLTLVMEEGAAVDMFADRGERQAAIERTDAAATCDSTGRAGAVPLRNR